MLIFSLSIIFQVCLKLAASSNTDPCSSFHSIENQERRSKDYKLGTDETDFTINDRELPEGEGWYRPATRLGTDMPTSAPDSLSCCTENPIWLDGELPTAEDGQVKGKVCIRSFTSICEKHWQISIKNCSGYYVYNLTNSPLIHSAYCFGSGGVPCPVGESSLTGYFPNCTDKDFPKDDISPQVASTLKRKLNGEELEPIFRCTFTTNSSRYYDVYWYINAQFLRTFISISGGNITNWDLLPKHWVGKHQMNMIVKCAARIRFHKDSLPSPFFHSVDFKAGVFPVSFQHEVMEGNTITIYYNSTVPVGCYSSKSIEYCNHQLYITQPKYQANEFQCTNDMKQKDLAFEGHQGCGLQIPSSYSGKDLSLKITGYVDSKMNCKYRSARIRLISLGENKIDPSQVWDNMTIPDVEVKITDADSQLAKRKCKIYNDPHFVTTDGKKYDYYGIGEYILYRHIYRPYQVHAMFTSCNGRASCICGIAVRSGHSLISLRTCKGISKKKVFGLTSPFMDKRICDDRSIKYRMDSSKYTIILPTGTKIEFNVGNKYIDNAIIEPSIMDIQSVEGLCGYVSKTKDPSDDFRKKDGETANNVKTFAASWGVTGTSESLFSADPPILKEKYKLSTFCECTKQATSKDDLLDFNELHCNISQPMEFCLKQEVNETFSSRCSNGHTIRRRDTRILSENSDDIGDEFPDLIIDPDVYDESIVHEVPIWRNEWNEEKAENHCRTYLAQQFPEEASRLSGVKIEDYQQSCVADIKITGDTEYLAATLGTMQSEAIMELNRNESLAEEKTEEGVSILEKITSQLCENDCSNHGICTNGTCFCDEDYGERDCSIQKSAAPTNIRIPGFGLCSTRSRLCKHTNVFGRFSSKSVFCKRRHFKITEEGQSYTSDPLILNAIVFDSFKISCDISNLQTRKRQFTEPEITLANGFEISVSNDGKNFSENAVIIIYDDLCSVCNSTTMKCEPIDTCPTITPAVKKTEKTTIVVVIVCITMLCILIVVFVYCRVGEKKRKTEPYLYDFGGFHGKTTASPGFVRK